MFPMIKIAKVTLHALPIILCIKKTDSVPFFKYTVYQITLITKGLGYKKTLATI